MSQRNNDISFDLGYDITHYNWREISAKRQENIQRALDKWQQHWKNQERLYLNELDKINAQIKEYKGKYEGGMQYLNELNLARSELREEATRYLEDQQEKLS